MRVRAILHGGSSYTWPDSADSYPSLRAVREEYLYRRTFHRTRHPEALGAPLWGDDDTPGGPEGTVVGLAWVGHGDPDTVGWAHDYELVVGPRGGVRWEAAA